LDWVFGTIQVVIGAIALWVAWKALVISRDVRQDTEREQTRADNRARLMWMQSVLNQLPLLQREMLAPHEVEYGDAQGWTRTCLAVGGLRHDLPLTMALAERPFGEDEGMVEAVDAARKEIYAALEQEGDRAYAGERLG
jgi:hypothetical protein